MVRLCRSPFALVLIALALAPIGTAAVRHEQADGTFNHVSARAVIEQLASSLDKSVVFDIDFHDEPINFDARGMPWAQALDQLLQQEGYFSVEVGGVLIVAPDAAYERNNYSPKRVAACLVTSEESARLDVSFHATPINEILKSLAGLLARKSVIGPAAASTSRRRYDIEMRNVTRAEAMAIACLATHLAVRDDGKMLEFISAATNTIIRVPASQQPPN